MLSMPISTSKCSETMNRWSIAAGVWEPVANWLNPITVPWQYALIAHHSYYDWISDLWLLLTWKSWLEQNVHHETVSGGHIVGQRWWQRKTLIETRQCVLLLRLLLLLRLRTSRRGFTEGGGTGGRSGRVRRADGKSKRNSSVARRPATWCQKIESRTRRGHLWWRNGRDPSSELVWKMSDGLSRERGKRAVEVGERICAVGVTVRVITTGGQIVRAATNGQLITILWT